MKVIVSGLLRGIGALAWLLALPAIAVAEDQTAALSRDPQWLALLHMRPDVLGILRSEADEPSFFLSGRPDDPQAELESTVAALRRPDAGEQSAWCIFPARAAWLQEKVGLTRPADLACDGLDRWRQQFHTDRLVLVFPDMYMHNPASVFGHTFFRFDAQDRQQYPVLLSTAMSYYAAVGTAGGTAAYILKGLSGGFDGVFEVRPYFEKIRKYSDNEDRDIHEYELGLSPEQIRLVIDHAWEVRGYTFNYFFLDENCSYRLLALLDAVVAPHTMRLAFSLDAMPLDTAKVLGQNGLLRSQSYVPSAVRVFERAYSELTLDQQQQLRAWASREAGSEDVKDAAVRHAAMQYAAIRIRQSGQHAVYYSNAFQQMLKNEARTPSADRTRTPVTGLPVVAAADPVQATHGTRRVGLAWQTADGESALMAGVRLAYHDEGDPLPGFEPGTRLEVMDLAWTWDGQETSLDHATWFAVRSRKPRSVFFQPVSWGFAWSRRRELFADNWSLVHALDAERGVSYDCGDWLCHAELTGVVLGGDAVDKGGALGLGGRVGASYQSSVWHLDMSIEQTRYLLGEQDDLRAFTLGVGRRLQRDLSAGLTLRALDNGEAHRETVSLGIRYFF